MDPVEDHIDEEFCYECGLAFPTLKHGQRYCQECAMLIMTVRRLLNG
jgi:hypothetical protein